ncbi:MAG: hypothetical protein ACKO14_02675 [Armatimonadota bacterium]
MEKCTGCGGGIPDSARFCPLCGKSIAAATTAPAFGKLAPPTSVPDSPTAASHTSVGVQDSKKWIIVGVAAIGLLGLGAFLAKTAGLLGSQPTATKSTAILAPPQTQTAAAPILQAPTTEAPQSPVLTPPGQTGIPMPEDVIAYLRWLKQYHADLRQVSSSLEGVAMQIIPTMTVNGYNQLFNEDENRINVPGQDQTRGRLLEVTSQLNQMAARFNGVRPPDPCAPLAGQYQQSMNLHLQQIAKLATLLEKIMENPADAASLLPELTGEMGSKSMSGQADSAVKGADQQLNTLRERYIDIPSDINRGTFQIDTLDSGLNAGKLLGGKGLGL